MLDKTFEAADVEPRIAQKWDEAGAFKAGAGKKPGAASYTIVIPPPNVTGSLHMGHALNNTLQDILIRLMRMRGRDVLWQPGLDHAGIATQMVVERQLMERQQPGRRAMGREAFINKVWEWKAESGGTIVNQLKRLGASCDWSRERFTMDEGLSKAVAKVFVQLYRDGLIYKDKRLVNWDPKLLTAISDLEVVQTEMKGHLWHLRYPLASGYDAEDPATYIIVATTRPETMLGDVAVAVNPEDDRYKDLVGKFIRLPLVGRLIPIIADDYSDPEKGSGAVKITPAHDFNDFEVGKRHSLKMISILNEEGAIDLLRDPEFIFSVIRGGNNSGLPLDDSKGRSAWKEDLVDYLHNHGQPLLAEALGKYDGLDRFAARKAIVQAFDDLGLLEKIEPHTHAVPHGDRSGVSIEPFLMKQWYVDAAQLAKPAIASVREGRTTFVPRSWENTYFQWMENIQPWCVSRQLWWGHQIPAWYGPNFRKIEEETPLTYPSSNPDLAEVFVYESEEAAMSAMEHYYKQKVVVVENIDAAIAASKLNNEQVYVWRDSDVLDTWFSSALWPFSTLGWPDQTPELARYYPTNVLVTGFDIIFFWVARMMMMGLHFMKDESGTPVEPFSDVYIHALVRDAKGAKMSKSKGNVIDPLELIDQYGADALRFTLAAMAAQGRDIKLDPARVGGYRNFATKLWNAVRFAEMNGCARVDGFDPDKATETLDRWIVTELRRAAADVSEALDAYRFNDAAGAIYRFVWNNFCDWYLELAKPVLTGEDSPAKVEVRATAAWAIDEILKLLHPFMPFITEELWAATGPARDNLLVLTAWPEGSRASSDAADEINWLISVISDIRSVRSEMGVTPATQLPFVMVGGSAKVAGWLETHGGAIQRLARVSSIASSDTAPGQSAQIVTTEGTVCLPLAGVIDLDAERGRLAKEETKLAGEIDRIDKKLSNEAFIARAPEDVVEEERTKREGYVERLAKVREALARLS